MRPGRSACLLVTAALSAGILGLAPPAAQAAAARWKATPTPVASVLKGAKSATGKLARSDQALLASTTTEIRPVVVKLDYDSLVAYRGDVRGYPATSPAATGKAFSAATADARRYETYVAGVEHRFTTALRATIGEARVGQRLRVAYGGVALTLPANRAKDLLRLPGVVAVQADTPAQPQTDASSSFIGATSLYPQLGGTANAGRGVMVGVLDTGAWPEHPSFADQGNLGSPPAKADGMPRACDFGDNPLTPASDPFVCNRKLIGGKGFLETYNAQVGGEVYGYTARDSDGHGTHTASTATGDPVASAAPLGIERGPVNGIAPGAWLSVYKVCGAAGCFPSDSAAAVGQAIVDGVRVINFSIGGGTAPYTDVVELSFLDAYAAGVLVSTSAGNSGPTAGTVNHLGPWVMTVAASTQTRAFQSTLTVSGGGASAAFTGASLTRGISAPLPVVLGSAPPYGDVGCGHPAPPGIFSGKIVVCQRGGAGRVQKGFNILQGGAAGMIVYNPTPADTESDNHWLPAIHLEDAAVLDFLTAHPGATASFPQGTKVDGVGDVMASFSSRGPAGDFLKPDVTAPGVQILAGHTPTPEDPSLGPPGQYFQAIAGTSMSSPHVAGSAALLFALHPTWTPGQVKSALETTGVTKVVKDRTTPADPFDMGGGRIDLTRAGNPGLTFDETAARFYAAGAQPSGRIDLNLPSVNAPLMPGAITTVRTARNTTTSRLSYTASAQAPAGTRIDVLPRTFTLDPGRSITLTIVITAVDAPVGQYFGSITLDEKRSTRDVRLPVAFYRQQGPVTLTQTCSPTTIDKGAGTSSCQVSVQNGSKAAARVDVGTRLDSNLSLGTVTGATRYGSRTLATSATLAAPEPASPTVAPGIPVAGYLPLDQFGIVPTQVGDEEIVNLDVAPFQFAGETYTRVGVSSNGFLIAGGGDQAQDNNCCNLTRIPDPARPNAVLAPFWTDLDGTGAPGIFAGTLTDGLSSWLVVEWRVNVFGTASQRVFETWIGLNGSEDITFNYDPGNLPASPGAQDFLVGAENQDGSRGAQLPPGQLPTEDLRVSSVPGAPGGSLTYSYTVKGTSRGVGSATTAVLSPAVRGATTVATKITVR